MLYRLLLSWREGEKRGLGVDGRKNLWRAARAVTGGGGCSIFEDLEKQASFLLA